MSSESSEPENDVVRRDVLEARCAILERSVRAAGTATAEQIAAVFPGGKDNPDRSAHGYLYFFGALSGWYAMGPQAASKASTRWDREALEELRDAMAAVPISLTLDSGQSVAVYPKSEFALHRVSLCALSAEWVCARRVALHESEPSPASLAALRAAIDAEAALIAEFCWILLHPGPGVPWSIDGEEHTPPDWAFSLTPFDVVAIRAAHLEVNQRRISAVAERSRHLAGGGSETTPLASFLGIMAGELGVQPERLVREWSLGAIFASALARFEAQERARQDSEASRWR